MKRWNRTETWIGLLVLAIGGVVLAVAGLWIYVSATTAPLHPNAQDIRSSTQSPPSAAWAGEVERARQLVRASVAEQNLPGVSVAVGVGGDVVWAEGFGFADIEKKVVVTPGTRFRIGTASIALTSAAAGLLIEKNRLRLDERIQAYVPEYPDKQFPVTVRQLMAHTAGVGSDGGDEGPIFGKHCDRPVDALPFIDRRELQFEPGSEYRYSRYGWILVSAAIEKAADQPFLTFMRQQIFEPLGMDDTTPDLETEPSPDRATSYFPRFAAEPRYGHDAMREVDFSCYAGSSIFLSTASDLARFALAINSGKLLQPSTVGILQASQRLANGQDTGYGLGWDLENATLSGEPTSVVGHNGDALGGIVSSLMTFPKQGIVVAVITNTSYADTAGLGLRIAESFAHRR